MAVITINQEFGTQGEKVGQLVAKQLGYEYLGKKLITQLSHELNLSEGEIEMYRKASQSRIIRFLDRYTCSVVQKVIDRSHGCFDDQEYFETTKRLIENLYTAGDVVILGWGAQCVLHGKPGVLHVHLTKDDDLKVREVMASHQIDESAATRFVEREEEDIKAYIKFYFKERWNDVRLFDLTIDMGKTSVEEAKDLITETLTRKVS